MNGSNADDSALWEDVIERLDGQQRRLASYSIVLMSDLDVADPVRGRVEIVVEIAGDRGER